VSFLSSFIWKAVFGAALLAALAGLWLRGEHYADRARTSEALLKAAVAIGNANAEIARTQSNLVKKIDAVQAIHALRTRAIRSHSDIRRKEIIDAPPDADGPLAPVLRDQLDRLPERPGADPRRDAAAAGDLAGPPVAK
jgi:hypothetical protein